MRPDCISRQHLELLANNLEAANTSSCYIYDRQDHRSVSEAQGLYKLGYSIEFSLVPVPRCTHIAQLITTTDTECSITTQRPQLMQYERHLTGISLSSLLVAILVVLYDVPIAQILCTRFHFVITHVFSWHVPVSVFEYPCPVFAYPFPFSRTRFLSCESKLSH
jgi:hypothetical protein